MVEFMIYGMADRVAVEGRQRWVSGNILQQSFLFLYVGYNIYLHWHEVLCRFVSRNIIEKYFCRRRRSQKSQLHKLGETLLYVLNRLRSFSL